jgi:NAD+--asparagine ADP-ribosyltransferase
LEPLFAKAVFIVVWIPDGLGAQAGVAVITVSGLAAVGAFRATVAVVVNIKALGSGWGAREEN